LLIWGICKERNKRIFKDQRYPLEVIWSKFYIKLKETLLLCTWTQEDLPSVDNEKAIWANWNIQLPQETLNNTLSRIINSKRDSWTAPPEHTFKLNFDGASKGNPGKAGYGGIFRNHAGMPLLIYFGNIG